MTMDEKQNGGPIRRVLDGAIAAGLKHDMVAPGQIITALELAGYDIVAIETIERQAKQIATLRKALKPFAGCVFNDNGDMTVDRSSIDHDDFVRAYITLRNAAYEGKADG